MKILTDAHELCLCHRGQCGDYTAITLGSGDPDANNLLSETEKGGGDAANMENGARTVDAGPAAALLPAELLTWPWPKGLDRLRRASGPRVPASVPLALVGECPIPLLCFSGPFSPLPHADHHRAESQAALIKDWDLSSPAESKRVGFWFHTLAVPRSRLLAGKGTFLSSWCGGRCIPEADTTPREHVGVPHPRVQSESLFP